MCSGAKWSSYDEKWTYNRCVVVVYTECISSRVSHQSCHFLTAVQLLLQMVDGWLGRVGSILALYRLLGSIQVLVTGSMGTFVLL